MLKKIKKLFNKSNSSKESEFFNDDIFIVSYPKSGNTWMRFLLANLMTEKEINFHSAVDYIPDFEVHKAVLKSLVKPRMLKSHSLYNENFSKIIYIIRDPRDVYVSYFHYLKNGLPESEANFPSFLRKVNLYPSRWQHHVESWIDNKKEDFILIRYEDLLGDTFTELKKVVEFIGWNKSEQEIKDAIQKSSFSSMSKLEDEKGRPFKSEVEKNKSSKFVRSGKKGDWKNYFNEEDLTFLNHEVGELAQKFGYKIKE